MAEVQTHNKVYDAWIILSNKVYNITPYLPYHPGGESIMQSVLGKDATILFHKYHTWVNIDNLIGPLYLGTLIKEAPDDKKKKNYWNNNDIKTNKNDDDVDDVDDDGSSRDRNDTVMPYASTNS
jgi:cytochrome b involved in lipid metabolism